MSTRTRRPRKKRGAKRIPRKIAPLGAPAMKYFDYVYNTVTTSTVVTSKMSNIPQGVAQSERIADTVFIRRMDVQMVLEASSNDVTNQIRWAMFNWIPNDTSSVPGSASYFESPVTFGPISPLNFEGRRNFRKILDRYTTLAGTGSAPTAKSIVNFQASVRKPFRIDFEPTTLYGSNHVYFSTYSNSTLSPHPNYYLRVRFWYSDTY